MNHMRFDAIGMVVIVAVFATLIGMALAMEKIAYGRTAAGVRYIERSKDPLGFWLLFLFYAAMVAGAAYWLDVISN